MDQNRFDTMTRLFGGVPSRRHLLRRLAGAGLGWGVARLSNGAEAKKERKHKQKRKKGLCKPNGSPCTKSGRTCKKQYCLNAPFTIEARWTEQADQDTVLFVPPEDATTGPAPHIHHACTPDDSTCEEAYPFACVDGDEQVAGAEVTTIYQLLPGKYEYWIELFLETTAGEVTIVLKDSNGRVVRQWASPANPSAKQVGWHVFDVNGNDGRVTAIDELIDQGLPRGAHDPNTYVCPN